MVSKSTICDISVMRFVPNMKAEGHPKVLGRGPERLVLGGVVGPFVGGVYGNHSPDEPHLGAALHLLDSLLQVVYVEHPHTLQPVGKGLAVLGNPVVIGL